VEALTRSLAKKFVMMFYFFA